MTSGLLEDASFNQSPAFGDVDLFTRRPAAGRCRVAPWPRRQGIVGLRTRLWRGDDARSRPRRQREPAQAPDDGRQGQPPRPRRIPPGLSCADGQEHRPRHPRLGPRRQRRSEGPLPTRAVRLYLATQAESGHLCPITMTHACIGALRAEPGAAQEVAAENPVAHTTIPGRCRGGRRRASRSAWA